MTDNNNEVENDFDLLEEELTSSTVLAQSIAKHEDINNSVESINNKEDRIAIRNYIKENGIEGNDILENHFKMILINAELLNAMRNETKQFRKDLDNTLIDIIASTKNVLDDFKKDTLADLDKGLSDRVKQFKDLNSNFLIKSEESEKKINEAFHLMNVSTMSASTLLHNHISKKVEEMVKVIDGNMNALTKEVKGEHELTEKIAIEMATKMFDTNKKTFKEFLTKTSEPILKNHTKEFDSIISRFNGKTIIKQIVIYSSSFFIAGTALIASYKFLSSWI